MSWNTTQTEPVILQPRPLEKRAGGILLLPLLPYRHPLKPLPAELWSRIFTFVYYDDHDLHLGNLKRGQKLRRDLLTVCKSLNDVASPVFYSRIWIYTVESLEQFTSRLHTADQKWDSIRRIPYSAPGRWVQSFDISQLDCAAEWFVVDELLTRLFPLLPFMAHLALNTSLVMSRRAFSALTSRDGTRCLKTLRGIKAPVAREESESVVDVDTDLLVQLIRSSPHLEELEIVGPGFDPVDVDFAAQFTDSNFEVDRSTKIPLQLNKLNLLTMVSTHSSPLMYALLGADLPSLRRLTLTPYDDIPYPASLVSRFIQKHGPNLRSLYLLTPKDTWPTALHPSPKDLLITCPQLNHLSLESPLPKMILPSVDKDCAPHPLQILSIPRPKADYLAVIEGMIPAMKNLKVVRARDVKWLRHGMTPRALEAGVQGEMREWRRRLNLRGIAMVDAENRDITR